MGRLRELAALSQKSAKSAGCLKSQGLLGTAPLVTTRHEYVRLAQSQNTKHGRHSPFSTGHTPFFLATLPLGPPSQNVALTVPKACGEKSVSSFSVPSAAPEA
jgi:hypothetical protein